jgi:hypothetical protein
MNILTSFMAYCRNFLECQIVWDFQGSKDHEKVPKTLKKTLKVVKRSSPTPLLTFYGEGTSKLPPPVDTRDIFERKRRQI